MKIANVLLLLFSCIGVIVRGHQVELEGKVPLVSNNDKAVSVPDISPMMTDPLASGTTSTTPNTEHLQIKESIANGRELNGELNEVCKKFKKGIAGDGTRLGRWCDEHNCCQGYTACDSGRNWSFDATYEVCENSCNGNYACYYVAGEAPNAVSIKFEEGSCNGANSCLWMAFQATNLQTLVVGKNSCSSLGRGYSSCAYVAYSATSLKQLIIANDQCKSSQSCSSCGRYSTFDDTLQLTETCCNAEAGTKDTACNYFDLTSNQPSNEPSSIPPPQEEPNPCKNVSCSNRGECQVLSLTEAECKCENTFIPSENKLDCICPSNHEFNADVNRCFPITEAPSKSPTISPTMTSSASPSQVATIQEDVCEDDETATFKLIKVDRDVPCSWITKNWKKRAIREEKYCGLDEVKAICPATCGLCS